jgi:acetyltransferase-like isoleucine patch superfamily enzyme
MNLKILLGGILNYSFNNVITHIPIHFVRKGFLRLCNRKISGSAVILMHTRILNFWKVSIGADVVLNQYCVIDCRKYTVSIGDHTDIGPYTKIWTLGHNPDSDTHELYGGNVEIGHHVWVASSVIILPSVIVGTGAVIAAGSVVHKHVSPSTIVGGNPARFLRNRNNALRYKLNFDPFLE